MPDSEGDCATKERHLDDPLAAVDLRLAADEISRLEEPYTPRTPGGCS